MNGASVEIDWNADFKGSILLSVYGQNNCGLGVTSDKSFTINPVITNIATPLGLTTLCENPENGIYQTTANEMITNYQWQLTPSEAGILSEANESVTINWADDYIETAELLLTVSNSCGSLEADKLTININSLPAAAGSITGTVELCGTENNTTYQISDVANATSYIWSLSKDNNDNAAGNISGNGTSIEVDWNNTFKGSTRLTVQPQNNCGIGELASIDINVIEVLGKTPTPVGETKLCQNPGILNYYMETGENATYTWQLTPSNAGSVIKKATGADISWNSEFSGNVNLTVVASNSCGDGTTSDPLAVLINAYPATPYISTVNDKSIFCYGDSLLLSATTEYANISWSKNGDARPETAKTLWAKTEGIYEIVVTDANNCASPMATKSLAQHLPIPDIVIKVIEGSNGYILVCKEPTGNYDFTWYENGNEVINKPSEIIGQGSRSLETKNGGTEYYLKITDGNQCTVQSEVIQLDWTSVAIVFPNPNNGTFTIQTLRVSKTHRVLVKDLLGKQIQANILSQNGSLIEIEIPNANKGIYLIEIYDDEGNRFMRKVFVE